MKNKCNIIRDILPLYVEDMVSADTSAFVEEHLEKCAECRAELEDMKKSNGLEKNNVSVADEIMPESRYTGIPDIERKSIFHALNSKAVSRKYAASIGKKYEDLNIIVVHLGGGISVGAHRKGQVIDVNNALDGEGPFSTERAGTVPAGQLVDLCFSGRFSKIQIKKMLNGRGGLSAHLGMNDMITIAAKAEAGEEPFKEVVDAIMEENGRDIQKVKANFADYEDMKAELEKIREQTQNIE